VLTEPEPATFALKALKNKLMAHAHALQICTKSQEFALLLRFVRLAPTILETMCANNAILTAQPALI
jgi:hypothetical protein